MLKMIIVEDEHRILQMIKKMVQWEELGVENAGEAENGIAAFDLIQAQKPDIVITDIRMPGMDGLELVRRTQELGLNIKFIFVSGHKHFEYAQRAVRYGVADYLVKPINKVELNNIIAKLVDRCLEETGRLEKERLLQNQLARHRETLHLQFLQSLMAEPDESVLANIDECNARYQTHFGKGSFQSFALKVDRTSPLVDLVHLALVAEQLSEITRGILKANCVELVCKSIGSQVISLANLERPDAIKAPMAILFEQLRKNADRHNDLVLTIGVGSLESELSLAPQSIQSARDALSARLTLGTNRILEAASLRFQPIPVRQIITPEREMQFFRLVEALDQESIPKWLEAIFADVAAVPRVHPKVYYEISQEIYRKFLGHVAELGFETGSSLAEEPEDRFIHAISVSELLDLIKTTIVGKLDAYLQLKRIQDAKPIRMAKQYIQDHYTESIGLEDVAREIHYNPVYFSILFKKEVGVNFSDYLIGYRVEKAKDLLKSTPLTIVEIAEQVGYKDSKYFSKMFTKIVGINPKEYRRLYS